MSQQDQPDQQQALGQPAGTANPDDQPDFAGEHDDTAVDEEIVIGDEPEREPESPKGWSGMEEA